MAAPKISVIIPYRQRLENIRIVLRALAAQTMNTAEFEVIIGVMEYSADYIKACLPYTETLRIESILTSAEWNVSKARNLGIRNAAGQVLLFLDADMVLPPQALANLYDRHFSHGQNVCVLGQLADYNTEVIERESGHVTPLPYSHYLARMARLDAMPGPLDARWSKEYASAMARFPWSFVTTALVAIPRTTVRQHALLFDEGFRGWGPEDQEWGYRVSGTGTPIVLGEGIYGVHMPHRRDTAANRSAAQANNRYYLAKWPRLDLELALAFGGWLEADRRYPEAERELAGAVSARGLALSVVRTSIDGADVLAVGVETDRRGRPGPATAPWLLACTPGADVFPLAGFSLPFADKSVDRCHVLAPIGALSEDYRQAVWREAKRVASSVVCDGSDL